MKHNKHTKGSVEWPQNQPYDPTSGIKPTRAQRRAQARKTKKK